MSSCTPPTTLQEAIELVLKSQEAHDVIKTYDCALYHAKTYDCALYHYLPYELARRVSGFPIPTSCMPKSHQICCPIYSTSTATAAAGILATATSINQLAVPQACLSACGCGSNSWCSAFSTTSQHRTPHDLT
eukprot:366112-Chlamydomonas_euryale.AAC.14